MNLSILKKINKIINLKTKKTSILYVDCCFCCIDKIAKYFENINIINNYDFFNIIKINNKINFLDLIKCINLNKKINIIINDTILNPMNNIIYFIKTFKKKLISKISIDFFSVNINCLYVYSLIRKSNCINNMIINLFLLYFDNSKFKYETLKKHINFIYKIFNIPKNNIIDNFHSNYKITENNDYFILFLKNNKCKLIDLLQITTKIKKCIIYYDGIDSLKLLINTCNIKHNIITIIQYLYCFYLLKNKLYK